MRNLYAKLNISPLSSYDEIEHAIDRCNNASLRTDASTVLLVLESRKVYDQLNAVLIEIGRMRGRLGLSHAPNWHSSVAEEYASTSDSCSSKYNELIEKINISSKQIRDEQRAASVRRFLIKALVLLLVIGFIWFISILSDDLTSQTPPTAQKPKRSKVEFTQPALPLPENGITRFHTFDEPLAPLKIITSTGSNYLVKLEDSITRDKIMDVFVQGGDEIEVEVPLGTYIIKYASGDTWYGYEYYFGPNTGYSKADKLFNFQIIGNQISGYSVTLYRVAHGNLRTSRIKPEDF